MDIYTRLNELGYELPAPAPKGGIYKPVKQVGSLLYVSGQGATEKGVPVICGLGAKGEFNHSSREYMETASLVPRAKLAAAAVLLL